MEFQYNCPLCNGLISVREPCPECGCLMEDWGRIQDYQDPYHPYLDMNTTAPGEQRERKCVHLFKCPQCGYDTRLVVNQILAP
ncbi:hypothetical protein [Thermosediminibacter litoriperuensis]|uniref:Uncharacterized protein n=1 Tax=Thermosediminibacter litoriperuensis TaxID=291989 RepID=A0A5S5AYG0_9FIRM|nr:hypothetical protein [Thermosediminibacter litoriperuensis]TYP57394.1 hypothetical protein LZ11_00705 [Thermosediminibacter litoriperuensis]